MAPVFVFVLKGREKAGWKSGESLIMENTRD